MKYTNKFNLPQAFVDVVDNISWDITSADKYRIGVTTLISPPRIRQLQLRHWDVIEEDVSEQIWRIMGNACHYVLSNSNDNNNLVEEKITEVVDGITVVAKPDLYASKEKSVDDWKITSVWAVMHDTKPEWEAQLNVYAWILRKAGFEVNNLFINAILKDWKRSELLRYGGDYPLVAFRRIKINLWSFEEQDKYVKERVRIHKEAMELEDGALPLCTPEERWAEEDKWAVYKGTNKTAYRVLDSEKEANELALNMGSLYTVKHRPGSDKRCTEYCNVCEHCAYYKEKYSK